MFLYSLLWFPWALILCPSRRITLKPIYSQNDRILKHNREKTCILCLTRRRTLGLMLYWLRLVLGFLSVFNLNIAMRLWFILFQPLHVPTSSPQATHLRFSTISVNLLQTFNTPWDPSPLCSRFSQSKRQPVSWLQLSFRDEQKDSSPLE